MQQKAPILLVPVELRRRTVRSKFKLTAGDDDAIINPALAYKLKQEWDVELLTLPDDLEELEPDDVFGDLVTRAEGIPGWRVTNEAALALFSFTKFVMYKDLEQHQEQVLAHPLVRRLLGADEHDVAVHDPGLYHALAAHRQRERSPRQVPKRIGGDAAFEVLLRQDRRAGRHPPH